MNHVPVAQEGLLARPTAVIPHFDRLVGGGRNEMGSVGSEGERSDGVLEFKNGDGKYPWTYPKSWQKEKDAPHVVQYFSA